MSTIRYESRDGTVLVPLKVVPGASRSRIVGPLGDRLKVAVSAAPEHGAANDEVCRVIADRLTVSPRQVRIVAGTSSPRKTVAILGCEAAAVRRSLEDNHGEESA